MHHEFFETPDPFTRFLFQYMADRGTPITGRLFEPCVGSGAIPRAADNAPWKFDLASAWVTNDVNEYWPADHHKDIRYAPAWDAVGPVDWTVCNPPFSHAIEIITQALAHSRVGVAMHLRASIHEVLKTGVRRTWMAEHLPTGILWLPRFAYQRSKTTGKWTTDNVCACWVVWVHDPDPEAPQFIGYAPEHVADDLDKETPAFRKRADSLMHRLALSAS